MNVMLNIKLKLVNKTMILLTVFNTKKDVKQK